MDEEQEMSQKFSEAEREAGAKIDSKDVLTKEEIHKFGVDIIHRYAEENGFDVLNRDTDIRQSPQLVLSKNNELFFVVIRTGSGDSQKLNLNQEVVDSINRRAVENGTVLLARVGLHCVGFGDTLVRGEGYNIDFRGFEIIE